MSEQGEKLSLVGSETAPAVQAPQTTEVKSNEPPKAAAPLVGAEPAPAPVAAPAAPLSMEALKFPEGVEVDQEMATGLLGVLNDQNLSAEGRAQALVDLHLKAVDAASEKASQFYRELQDEWVGQAVKEFGGEEKLKPILGDVAKLIDEFGGTPEQRTELRDLFSLTGAGNSPRMVGFLHNIAQKLAVEGKPATGGSPPNAGRSAAEILYPNMARG